MVAWNFSTKCSELIARGLVWELLRCEYSKPDVKVGRADRFAVNSMVKFLRKRYTIRNAALMSVRRHRDAPEVGVSFRNRGAFWRPGEPLRNREQLTGEPRNREEPGSPKGAAVPE